MSTASKHPVEEEDDLDAQKDKYLTFHIASEDYGIAIVHVTEIIGMQRITQVPKTPAFIKGVINLRGKVIPVMDVRLRFRMPGRDYDERTCIIVVQHNEATVGLVVDTVSEVLDIPKGAIEVCSAITRDQDNFVSGMGKVGDSIKMLIDVHRLLFDDTLEKMATGQNA
jgi:purine-binding chemotaxis protein CheW